MFRVQTCDENVRVDLDKLSAVAPTVHAARKFSPNTSIFKLTEYDAVTFRTWLKIFVHKNTVIVDRQMMINLAELTEYLGADAYVLYDKMVKTIHMEDLVELAVIYGGAHSREVIRSINAVNTEPLSRIGVDKFIKILEEGRRDLAMLVPMRGISSVSRDYILNSNTTPAQRVRLMTWRPSILTIFDAARVRERMIYDAIEASPIK